MVIYKYSSPNRNLNTQPTSKSATSKSTTSTANDLFSNRNMQRIRPIAYASEVGESFRPITSLFLVRFLYGVSWGYIFLDTGLNIRKLGDKSFEIKSLTFFDTFTWHILASLVLPATTIHAIVGQSKKIITKINIKNKNILKFGPTFMGLCSIPFIIHPLDHLTDYFMDNTLRKLYSDKLPKKLEH